MRIHKNSKVEYSILYSTQQSMFIQNLSSLAFNQTDLDTFLTIFEENFRIFQENSLENSEKFQTWVCNFIFNLAKHVHAKFELSSSTQTDLDTFLTIFEENSRIFQKNSLANSKNFQTWLCSYLINLAKHVHAKCQLSNLYPDGLRHIFDLFSRKIQDFL
jgi:hypothetical protein